MLFHVDLHKCRPDPTLHSKIIPYFFQPDVQVSQLHHGTTLITYVQWRIFMLWRLHRYLIYEVHKIFGRQHARFAVTYDIMGYLKTLHGLSYIVASGLEKKFLFVLIYYFICHNEILYYICNLFNPAYRLWSYWHDISKCVFRHKFLVGSCTADYFGNK